jgi:hypothetical protein
MGPEKVVAAAQREDREVGRTRKRRARKGVRLRLLRCTGAPGLCLGTFGLAAMGLSCRGPLSDACDELGTCAPSGRADASLEASSDTSSCDPTKDPKDDPCVLDSAYGVFVASAGSDAGAESLGSGEAGPDGTAERPYTSIGQALANMAGKSRVYVCNGVYAEQVSITAAVSLYGGLSCAAGSTSRVWSYAAKSAQVTAPPSAYALFVTGVQQGSVTIEDMSFAAPDAVGPGTSSLAGLIASSSVRLERVVLSAGQGANGAPGSQSSNYVGAAPAGGSQVSAGPAGSGILNVTGGAGAVNRCTLFGMSAGGDGGLGCGSDGGISGLGSPGTATPPAPLTMAGRDGLSRGTILPDAGGAATLSDDPGADGVASEGGVAAPAQDYGSLSADGWVASQGRDGNPGDPGQGGAGATDPLYGQCGTSSQSVGGGGGGAGGCGGAGGKGGGGGGGSIALASVASNVTLSACSLNTVAGGTGGAGGAGQQGQAGAQGGDTSFPSEHAAGAFGGNGAGGSGGAGGTGGISVGVLASGSTITMDGPTAQNTRLGAPGAGGAAGPGGGHGSIGTRTTGLDGNSGASGNAGTSVALLKLM